MSAKLPALHDAYAGDYDRQIAAYGCYLAEALFGLAYEWVEPGERLLDLGIGSGLSARLFAKAGLKIFGMDFSAAMLEICRAKGLAEELRQQDLLQVPWPYTSRSFDHVVCCGVMHFIGGLEPIFEETERVLRPGGIFAYTTKEPASPPAWHEVYHQDAAGEFDVFAHSPGYVTGLNEQCGFEPLKVMRSYVADDVHSLWVVRKSA